MKGKMIKSGFRYPPDLALYGVTEEDWKGFIQAFTSQISKAKAKLYIALLFFLMGGFPAAIGAYPILKSAEKIDFTEKVDMIMDIIAEYDRTVFRPRGLIMRLDLFNDGRYMNTMDIWHKKHADNMRPLLTTPAGCTKKQKSHLLQVRKKYLKCLRVVIEPITVMDYPDIAQRNGWAKWDRESEARMRRTSPGWHPEQHLPKYSSPMKALAGECAGNICDRAEEA
jgi:hypothetical protein